MDVVVDGERFDAMQIALITEVAREVGRHLLALELPADRLVELTGDITFSVGCLVDGARSAELHGKELNPILLFAPDDQVIGCGGNSYMHEYVARALEVAFPVGDS